MLRYRLSEVALTSEDIENARLRINDRKITATFRPPPSLRLSMVVSPERATIRRGPERSRDDAVIHPDDASAFSPDLHAEYVSLRRNCTSTDQQAMEDRTAHQGSDSFLDSAESISTQSLPAVHYDRRHSQGDEI